LSRTMILQFLLFGVGIAQSPVRTTLEAAAAQIDLIAPLDLGNYVVTSSPATATSQTALSRLWNSDYSTAELRSLLADPSPRIRVLALELLFSKQDPQLLPDIVRHTTDNERTFDRLEYYDYRANGPPSSRRASQTVADFAKAMANFYGVRGDFGE